MIYCPHFKPIVELVMLRDAFYPPLCREVRVRVRMRAARMCDFSLVSDVDVPGAFASVLGKSGEAVLVHHMDEVDRLQEARVGFGFLH